MLKGENLVLTPIKVNWKSDKLKNNPEIQSLLTALNEFSQQKRIIYLETLIVSNNEYEIVYSKYGKRIGKKRIQYEIELINLKQVDIYDKYINFHITNDNVNTSLRIDIKKDFFYFIEFEEDYYN